MFRENKDAYFLGMGDWLHMINPSDARWGGTELREEFTKSKILAKVCQAELEDLADKMTLNLGANWIKEHILGGLSGNHPFKKKKDYAFDPWDMFCERAGIRNLGYSAIVPLVLEIDPGSNSMRVYIMIHHGFGGAKRTEGGDMTAFSRHAMQYNAHVCVYGHTHNKWSKRIPMIGWRHSDKGPLIMEEYTKVVAQSGTFQQTLANDLDPTWAETKGFPPRDLGWLTVYVTLRRVRTGGRQSKWLDINAMD
jgi:hypothetical protein